MNEEKWDFLDAILNDYECVDIEEEEMIEEIKRFLFDCVQGSCLDDESEM